MPRPLDEFLAKYGEMGRLVLKAIYEEALAPKEYHKLGDFSYKSLKKRLSSYGLNYNPSPLLRVLEREIGLIETTYKSSNQHWWRITDFKSLKGLFLDEENELEPRVRLLKIQFYSTDPYSVLSYLKRIIKKRKLNSQDKRIFKNIVYEALPRIVDFLEKSEEWEAELVYERELADNILDMAEMVSLKLKRSIGEERLYENSLLAESSEAVSDKEYSL